MPVIEESVVIDRPPNEVFAFLTDPENIAVYNSNVVEWEQIAGDGVEPGARYRGTVRVLGRRMELTAETLQVEEGSRFLSESKDAPIPYTLEVRYEAEGGGTKVTWRQETDSYGGFFGKMADPLVTKLYSRDVRTNLEKAKTLMEG